MDFGLLVLPARAESFNQAPYESIGLAVRATARMYERLEASISAG